MRSGATSSDGVYGNCFFQRKIPLALDTWPRKSWFGRRTGKLGIINCDGIGNEAGRNIRGDKGRKSRNYLGENCRTESKLCPIPIRALSARHSLDTSRDRDPSRSNAQPPSP